MENNVIISIQEKQSFEAQGDELPSSWSRRLPGAFDGDDGYTPELSGERAHRPGGHPDHLPDRAGPGHAPAGGEVNSQMVFEEGGGICPCTILPTAPCP